MVAFREQDLLGQLKKRAASINGLLLFGNDESSIAAATRQIIHALAGGEEPLRLDAAALRSDPAVLDDAFRSMSLLGDRRVVVVSGVDENHVASLVSVIDAEVIGNFVVLIAGSLKKTSKLRLAAEASPLFGCVAFYEEAAAAAIIRVQSFVSAQKLELMPDAATRLLELCGTDRALLMSEAEKLTVYCNGQNQISVEDVEAVCGDQAEFESDMLFSALCDGDAEKVDRAYASMALSGDGKSVLILLQLFLARLDDVSASVARGIDMATACRSAKPPFFDKQQSAVARYLRFLSGDDLGKMQVSVQAAILQSRQLADLGDAIAGRCLISLARMCRQSRARLAA